MHIDLHRPAERNGEALWSASTVRSSVLFQFHEEQHKNRPYSDRHGELHQRGVAQGTSGGIFCFPATLKK